MVNDRFGKITMFQFDLYTVQCTQNTIYINNLEVTFIMSPLSAVHKLQNSSPSEREKIHNDKLVQYFISISTISTYQYKNKSNQANEKLKNLFRNMYYNTLVQSGPHM